jgi:GNAT superfamily N-acetyltransferase
MTFSTRLATLDDIKDLLELRMAMLQEITPDQDEEQLAMLRAATRHYLEEKVPKNEFMAWIAEAEGQIVGSSGLIFLQKSPILKNLSGLEAYILNMYTTPAWRGQGIARALLQELIRFVKGTRARRIWLHASADGKLLYEKIGFVEKHHSLPEMELYW